MKTLLKISCTICFSLLFFSCEKDTVTASDEVTSRTYSFSGYTALDITDNFNVEVTFSNAEEKIEVEANDNLHGYIDVDQIGDKLVVKLKDVRKIRGTETLNMFITTKKIIDFKASGNSKVVIKNVLDAPVVNIDLTGNSWFTGTMTTNRLQLVSKGNCMVDLSGSTGILEANLSGNCELSDYDLTIEALKIDLSGNSNAYLTVSNSIDIVAKGNSVLSYKGEADIIHQDLSSASKIIKK